MSNRQFDWDKFCSQASFNEVRNLSPDLESRRLPSMFSPDRKLLLLSSQDIEVETDNEDDLRSVLYAVRDSYASALRFNPIDHASAYIFRKDFIEVCQLLAHCTDDPDEFSDPDSHQ